MKYAHHGYWLSLTLAVIFMSLRAWYPVYLFVGIAAVCAFLMVRHGVINNRKEEERNKFPVRAKS